MGMMANVEAAAGLDDRYYTRAMLMGFTDRLQSALFGSMNNLSEDNRVIMGRQWDSKQRGGVRYVKDAGFNMSLTPSNSAKVPISSDVDVMAERATHFIEQFQSTQSYLPQGDRFGRSRQWDRNAETKLGFDGSIRLRLPRIFFSVNPVVNYQRGRKQSDLYRATLTGMPFEAYRGAALDSIFGADANAWSMANELVSQTSNLGRSLREQWDAKGIVYLSFRSPVFGNNVSWKQTGDYSRDKQTSFSHYDLKQPILGGGEFRNRYVELPSDRHGYASALKYTLSFSRKMSLDLGYDYTWSRQSADRNYFLLNRLPEWGAGTLQALGTLPSERDALRDCLDAGNSYASTSLVASYRLYGLLRWDIHRIGTLDVTLPLDAKRSRLYDWRQGGLKDCRAASSLTALNPSFKFKRDLSENRIRRELNVNYSLTNQDINPRQLQTVRDDTNPLSVRVGNPGLQNPVSHTAGITWSASNFMRRQRMLNISANYTLHQHMIGQALTYDPATDVRTYQPRNISGNYNGGVAVMFNTALDSLNRWSINTRTECRYANNADYVSTLGGAYTEPYRSCVRNAYTSQHLTLGYSKKGTSIYATASVEWNNLDSRRPGFQRVNAWDIHYSLNATTSLPWDIKANSSLTLYSRRGYNDRNMNDDRLVWNASLSRTFLKKKDLTVKLEGRDLLNRLSRVTATVNAQGRTETWNNVLPSYVMMHLMYRLSVIPKKQR